MKRGFTLIELLVVIAIIAVLASIMFPVFAKAREKANMTSCLNNQRQIVTAILMYTQEHDEILPTADNWLGAINLDKGVLNCPNLSGSGPDYTYNAGSHLSGQPIGAYNAPADVLVVADAARKDRTDLTLCDAGSGSADVITKGQYNRQVDQNFGTTRHNGGKGLNAVFLDGHGMFLRTDTAATLAELTTYINNAHADGEPVSTTYVKTNMWTSGPSLAAPANTLIGAGWYNVSSTVTLLTTPNPPAGYSITFPAAGGASQNRVSNMSFTACGISTTDRRCQICSGGFVRANMNLDLAAGKAAELHISWGAWTDNSDGGATLSVTDNTNGVVIDSTTSSDLAFYIPFNVSWYYRETIVKVGTAKSISVEVRDSAQPGRAWLQSLWLVPVN
jgi:prepilin-type N-terminal cleavage/methylation domain-containing protein/prepilin-type processing-associated H-X9-DG protein